VADTVLPIITPALVSFHPSKSPTENDPVAFLPSHSFPPFFPFFDTNPDHPCCSNNNNNNNNDDARFSREFHPSFSRRVLLPIRSPPLPPWSRLSSFPSFSVFTIHVQLFGADEATTPDLTTTGLPPHRFSCETVVDAEARNSHFYETLRCGLRLRGPLGTNRPIDPSTDDRSNPPFVPPLALCAKNAARPRFVGASSWNSCATIYSKSISRLPRARVRADMYESICKRSRCAKKLRELGRGFTIFLRACAHTHTHTHMVYIYIPGLSACYDLCYVFRVGIKSSKRIFARKQ